MKRLKRKIRLLQLFEGVDFSKRKTPLMILKSSRKGPIIWICGAIHGDEVTGVEIIQKLFDELEAGKLLKGTVFAIPVLNPLGFEMVSRVNPYDDEDLNRQFPGDKKGTTAERMAFRIFSEILKTKPDFVVDLHTDSANSVGYTIIDNPADKGSAGTVRKVIEIAELIDLPWALDYSEHAGYPLEKSLSGCLVKHGIPAFTVELGGPLVINQEFVQKGLASLKYILSYFGMLKYAALPVRKSCIPKQLKKPLCFFEEIRSEKSGIVNYTVRPGQYVKKGQTLAKIKSAIGKYIEVIKSPHRGLVLSLVDQSVSFPGSDLFTLAVEDKKSALGDIKISRMQNVNPIKRVSKRN